MAGRVAFKNVTADPWAAAPPKRFEVTLGLTFLVVQPDLSMNSRQWRRLKRISSVVFRAVKAVPSQPA